MGDKSKIILPSGHQYSMSELEEDKTSRGKERLKEDLDYVPVIIKRIDEAVRHPDDILEKTITEGLEQHKRFGISLFLSAFAAGLILGFAAMCVAIVLQIFPRSDNALYSRLATAFVYPLGFIICIMSRTQLFTEHTATAVYPILDKKASFQSLLNLWIIVLIGNLCGTFTSSLLISMSDPVIQAKEGYISVANHLMQFSFYEIFISAILAGWLMAQGGWLVFATSQANSQILCIYVVTFIIGLGGLHHSIVGSAEIFYGLLQSNTANYYGALKFLISAVLGNLVGGSLFIAVLNYGHIKKTQQKTKKREA